MTKLFTKIICLQFILGLGYVSHTQGQVHNYTFKKGQVFDVVLLNTNPDTKETRKRYFETAYPIATDMGYLPEKGYPISGSALQGNFQPHVMVFGQWPNMKVRDEFLNTIEEKVPDFHEMRREIWGAFYLTYWEMTEDLEFSIDADDYHVVTAYWAKEGQRIEGFRQQWERQVARNKGGVVLSLTNGTSPFGYYYNPDYFSITKWESKEAFEAFQDRVSKLDHSSLAHVNQFHIQTKKPNGLPTSKSSSYVWPKQSKPRESTLLSSRASFCSRYTRFRQNGEVPSVIIW